MAGIFDGMFKDDPRFKLGNREPQPAIVTPEEEMMMAREPGPEDLPPMNPVGQAVRSMPYEPELVTNDLYDEYMQGPKQVAPPPSPSLKDILKQTALGMIPIVGTAMNQKWMQDQNQKQMQYKQDQELEKSKFTQQESLYRPIIQHDIEQQKKFARAQQRLPFLVSQNGGDQDKAWRDALKLEGLDMTAPGTPDKETNIMLKLRGVPEARAAMQKGNQFFLGDEVTGQWTPVPPGNIETFYNVGTQPQPQKPDAINTPFELYMRNAKNPTAEEWFTLEQKFGSNKLGLAEQLRNMMVARGIPLEEATRQALLTVPQGSFNMQQPVRADARNDRSYQYHSTQIDTELKPLREALSRFSRLEETVNAETPQADALVAPELLTVMAGGMGSGLRMNEAEIARIIGGRSKWETLKAKINLWKTDSEEALTITPDQRQQIRSLMAAVRKKADAKHAVLSKARQALIDNDTVDQHRAIYSRMQNDIFGVDQGTVRYVNGQFYDLQKDGTWLPR